MGAGPVLAKISFDKTKKLDGKVDDESQRHDNNYKELMELYEKKEEQDRENELRLNRIINEQARKINEQAAEINDDRQRILRLERQVQDCQKCEKELSEALEEVKRLKGRL